MHSQQASIHPRDRREAAHGHEDLLWRGERDSQEALSRQEVIHSLTHPRTHSLTLASSSSSSPRMQKFERKEEIKTIRIKEERYPESWKIK